MTFLELCQSLVREAAISGSIVSVSGQTGEAASVVDWIAKAYRLIQVKHANWSFMRSDVTFDTVAGTGSYASTVAGSEFGEWHFAPGWRAYLKSTGVVDEQPLRFCEYDAFRGKYHYGFSRLATDRPLVVTATPAQGLILWPIPNAIYTIVGEQYRAPQKLLANDDVPVLAAKFHDVIVYRALMMYAEYEGEAGLYASAQIEYNALLARMEDLYLPAYETAGPMA